MPTAEARIDTLRAARYLAQLVDHLGHMGHGAFRHGRAGHSGPPEVRHIERHGDSAVIAFDWGTCTLTATADALNIRADAADDPTLNRGQALSGRRIETIGRREHLTVIWQRPSAE